MIGSFRWVLILQFLLNIFRTLNYIKGDMEAVTTLIGVS